MGFIKMTAKSKGNTFERKISKLLSDRFKALTGLDQSFRRNIDSGSFFGGSNQRRKITHDLDNACFGDIMCPVGFKFSLECKHYKTPPGLGVIVASKSKQWDGWLEQAEQDSENSGKRLMVIIKYNNIEEFVFLKESIDIDSIFNYGVYKAYRLSDLLNLPDDFFFES